MNTLPTISTKEQAVSYLINSCGIKPNWAKAMVTEFYSFDHPTLLQTFESQEMNECVVHSEQEVISMYEDWLTYGVTETAEGITFDNSLVYDLNGDYLKHE